MPRTFNTSHGMTEIGPGRVLFLSHVDAINRALGREWSGGQWKLPSWREYAELAARLDVGDRSHRARVGHAAGLHIHDRE